MEKFLKKKKKRRLQTWLGFEGSAPSHQPSSANPGFATAKLGQSHCAKGKPDVGGEITESRALRGEKIASNLEWPEPKLLCELYQDIPWSGIGFGKGLEAQ